MASNQAFVGSTLIVSLAGLLGAVACGGDTSPAVSARYTPTMTQSNTTAGQAAPAVPLTTAGSSAIVPVVPTTPTGPTSSIAANGGRSAVSGSAAGSGAGLAGAAGTSGGSGAAGRLGSAGTGAAGSAGSSGSTTHGDCCPDGDCLCHGPAPMQLTSANGPFKTAQAMGTTGTIVYPTDAEPPFAAIAICPGFLNTGPEMAPWGPFYASYGIVTAVTNTGGGDLPDQRGKLLLGAIEELKKMNADSKSPLFGKLAGRYGTSGYSMGGGGTTIIAQSNPTLKTSIGLAPWGGNGPGTMVPELLLCGDADTVAPCDMAQSVYTSIPAGTPKMIMVVPGATHFNWFSPTDAGGGESGKYALAFQKVYLEGDVRWKSLLLQKPAGGSVMTDIQ
jgi:hypothetical protein